MLFLFAGLLAATANDATSVTVINDLSTYDGTDTFVYNQADGKVYVLNNIGEYEEYGILEQVVSLDIVADRDIRYIETIAGMNDMPYINTGYVFKANTRIIIDFEINDHVRTWEAPFGSRNNSFRSNAFVFFSRSHNTSNTGAFNRTGEETQGEKDLEIGQRYILNAYEQTCNIYTYDDTTNPYSTIITGGRVEDGVNSMFIFDLNTAGINDTRRDHSESLMKLYGFKIYEGEQLIMDLQPIINPYGKAGLRDKISGKHFYSETSQDFLASPDAPSGGTEPQGVTVYEGKIVENVTNGHAYQYTNGEWVDLGTMSIPIADKTYKNMLNWVYPEGKEECFAGISYDEVNDKNHIANYIGGPNHEPFFCSFPTEENQRYKVSFNYSCDEWTTWNGNKNDPNVYMRAVVLNNAVASTNFTENGNSLGGANGVLAAYQLPHEETKNLQVNMTFTAERDMEYLLLQYGYVADNIPYNFDYDYITVCKIVSPKEYSYTPYLSALITIAETSEILATANLMKELENAINRAKQVLTSTDIEEQKAAYEALRQALENALNYAAVPEEGDLIFNELMAANVDMFMSPACNFDSWVEFYNTSDKPLDLGGCYMSDDQSNPMKWKMPKTIGKIGAYGHKVVWLGSNDINTNQGQFKLDCEGGQLLFSNADGKILASMTYPEAISRASFARTKDGGDDWGWTSIPTPNTTNNNSIFVQQRLAAPVVSPDGGLFSGSLQITVNIPAGAILRYTTNGTTPTETNGEVSQTGIFTCNGNTDYRFRIFADGFLPSPVVTRSYILKNHDYTLPIISVTTKEAYLYDNEIGVYTKGTNGKTGNGQSTPANWNMPWDRPVNFQYVLPEENEMVVSQEVSFKISGGWTRSGNPKSFKLKADRVYEGLNAIDYPFFDVKPFNKNKTLQVRAGGNDTGSRVKDAAIQTILQRSGINIDLISYQPATHFINGQYRGLINVREPNNKDFAYANFGLSKDELEVFEQSPDSGRYMMVGTMETLTRLDELSEDCEDPAIYEEIKQLIDIDEYVNYMAAELYLGSWDWPDNNVKGYRKLDGGKYRIVMFDMDAAFETDGRAYGESGTYLGGNFFRWIDDMQWHRFDYIYDEGGNRYGEQKFCTFFLNMLNNDDFRRRLIDAFCVMGGSVFDEERSNNILAELGNRVRTTMSWEGLSPDGSLNSIRNALNGRVHKKVDHMIDYERLQLADVKPQAATLSTNANGAKLFINNIEVPYSSYNGYLFAPVTLRAEAPAGYVFEGWKKSSTQTTNLIAEGAVWTYYDQGSLDGKNWTDPNYSTTGWKQGESPLGYSKDQTTTIDYGGNASRKYPTYYFRNTVSLSQTPTNGAKFVLNYTVDDGFIIYVNGVEAGRYNMPNGNVTFETMAASDAKSNPDKGTMQIDASFFKQGYNTIAVEVHNNSWTSTDILWNATLQYTGIQSSNQIYSADAEIEMPTDDTFNLQASFKALNSRQKLQQGYTNIRINEVSGANSIFVNDYFKRNDWVELYNTTSNDIDVEGMYLSDNLKNPKKWQITKGDSQASTIVPAHGYLVIWCDKLEPVSQLHAPFKIDADGGEVVLTAKNESWSDKLHYPAHNGEETVGRYPDGSHNVYLMTMPTIGKSNMWTSYTTNVDQSELDGVEKRYVSSNNGLKISYAADRVIVRSDEACNGSVSVYSLAGQQLITERVTVRGDRTEVDVRELPTGCYVARVVDSEGRAAACKFIKGE
ncbi:MAG: CotH kinase family protein [Prevotella sp.]|nr:CotH kinase family protein [Prevotella sp.]